VTNGTAAGTFEFTGISGANAAGLNPSDMTVFNGEVLFNGTDTADHAGLWVTNGTAAGTHELTGISGANAAGLNPSDMRVLNGEVLFNGVDTAGDAELWVTNGTVAGTHELTGIGGANAAGLNPSDMTVFNGEVLFNGTDAAGNVGLWVTNGTVAGTYELSNIPGENTGGLNPEAIAAATPTDPVLNVSSFTIGVQQSVPVSSFFTITNPTGDSITEYSFEDNGGGSGHFTVGGSVEFFSGQPFTITANNLSSVEYVGGVSAGTDTITLDAYDATAGAWLPAVSLNAVTMAPFPLVNASDVTEGVYIGYFGRAGDPGGDSYWLNQLASGKISETGMATSFSAQPEAIAEYPFLANPSTATQAQIGSFIDAVYEDLFDRLPDSGGLAYWQNVLTTNLGNPQGVGAFILNVISGAQDIDQTTISNKVTVADYFTQELSSDGISFSSSADSLAHSAIASVTSDHSTVLAAESTINIFVAAQSAGAQVALVGASHTDLVSPVN
jgi:ELWxxDGT repeat protein